MDSILELIENAARILAGAKHAIALTGAGVSTPSGIPDFRGPKGLWRRVPPELFDISYFMSDPMSTWRVFLELYDSLKSVEPNPAHYSLAWLEKNEVIKAIITQNIDGLHQRAGSRRVVELHGSLEYAVCVECGRRVPLEEAVEMARLQRVPRCPYCGGVLKPDVVFFGEPLPERELMEAFQLARRSDAILVAGSSLYVSPANIIPEIVKRKGGRVIIVNLGEIYSPIEPDILIEAPVEDALPRICVRVAERKGFSPEGCSGKVS